MSTPIPFIISNALSHLQSGGVIAYPTEAVYGLGCDPLNERAVMRILEIKQRPIEKGLILIASELQQLEPYLKLNKTLLDKITPTWPGPVTWVIPAQDWVPKYLTGDHDTLAVRVTAHPLVRALCGAFAKPLVSTSANPSDQLAFRSAQEVLKCFGDKEIYIVEGSVGQSGQETAIYDAVSGRQFR